MVSKNIIIGAVAVIAVIVVVAGVLILFGSGSQDGTEKEKTVWPGFYDSVYYNNSTDLDADTNAPFVQIEISIPADQTGDTVIDPFLYTLNSNGTEYPPHSYSIYYKGSGTPIESGTFILGPLLLSPSKSYTIDLLFYIPTQSKEYIFSFRYYDESLPIERFPGEEDGY
jgi:hypothetical protein